MISHSEPECLLSFSMEVRSLSLGSSVQARVRVILYLCCDAAAGHVKFAVNPGHSVEQWHRQHSGWA